MWKNQLKVTNKPSIRTDVKPIPQPEKGDCIRWLRGLYDLYEKHNAKNAGLGWDLEFGKFYSGNEWIDIPEELACDIKLYLETSREISINGLLTPLAEQSEHHPNYNQYLFEPWMDKYDIYISSFSKGNWIQNNVVVIPDSDSNKMLKMQFSIHLPHWGDASPLNPQKFTDLNLAVKEIYQYMGRHDLWIKHVNNFENNIWNYTQYGRMSTEIHNSLKW